MGTYLPPGSCDAELQGLKDTKEDLETAWRNYQSAEHNMQAGGAATAGAGIGALGCVFFMTGVGAAVCLGGMGAGMISGELWTLSAGEALISAEEALDDAIKAAEDSIKAACKCYDSHTVSVPDE